MAYPQLQSNITTNGTSSTSVNTVNNRSALIYIVVPFAVVLFASIVGLGVYLALRSRRRSRKARARQGQTDAEQGSVPGSGSGAGAGARNGMPVVEGLNELGEAPPPYGVDEGVKEVREPVVQELERGESSTSVRSPDGDVDSGGGAQPAEEQPPPAYFTAEARDVPRLFLTPPTPG